MLEENEKRNSVECSPFWPHLHHCCLARVTSGDWQEWTVLRIWDNKQWQQNFSMNKLTSFKNCAKLIQLLQRQATIMKMSTINKKYVTTG